MRKQWDKNRLVIICIIFAMVFTMSSCDMNSGDISETIMSEVETIAIPSDITPSEPDTSESLEVETPLVRFGNISDEECTLIEGLLNNHEEGLSPARILDFSFGEPTSIERFSGFCGNMIEDKDLFLEDFPDYANALIEISEVRYREFIDRYLGIPLESLRYPIDFTNNIYCLDIGSSNEVTILGGNYSDSIYTLLLSLDSQNENMCITSLTMENNEILIHSSYSIREWIEGEGPLYPSDRIITSEEIRNSIYSFTDISYCDYRFQLSLSYYGILARHGIIPNDKSMQVYFLAKEWYNGIVSESDFDMSFLTDIERANIDVIMSLLEEDIIDFSLIPIIYYDENGEPFVDSVDEEEEHDINDFIPENCSLVDINNDNIAELLFEHEGYKSLYRNVDGQYELIEKFTEYETYWSNEDERGVVYRNSGDSFEDIIINYYDENSRFSSYDYLSWRDDGNLHMGEEDRFIINGLFVSREEYEAIIMKLEM